MRFFASLTSAACAAAVLFLAPALFAQGAAAGGHAAQNEEQGIDPAPAGSSRPFVPLKALPSGKVLLIPDSSADVVSVFDPQDGHYLGDLINGAGLFTTPINAVQGPDGNIYVSDQVKDSVFVFDTKGNFLMTYADATDGLDNVRGIDFRADGHLFVTLGTSAADVIEFTGPHQPVTPAFLNDASDPFDIHFLPDGSFLLADIAGTTDGIRHYDPTGNLIGTLVSTDFPEQVRPDTQAPGDFLTAAFTSDRVDDFDLQGVIHQQTPLANSGRGAYRLGNGNLLVTGFIGVQEIQPGTGTVINQIMTGTGWRFIEEATLSEWDDLGFALPGTLGAPVLTGEGPLSAGSQITLTLSNALPNSLALLVIGTQNLSAPFLGGTLVPSPDIVASLPTGPAGQITIPATVPAGLPAGIPIYVQYWIQDPGGPQGAAASNAIHQDTK